jgi:hypothetical protein
MAFDKVAHERGEGGKGKIVQQLYFESSTRREDQKRRVCCSRER